MRTRVLIAGPVTVGLLRTGSVALPQFITLDNTPLAA